MLLLGVFPRGREPFDLTRMNTIAINQIARRFADRDRVHYMDLADVFIAEDGMLP